MKTTCDMSRRAIRDGSGLCAFCARKAKVSARLEDGELADLCSLHFHELGEVFRDEDCMEETEVTV